MRDFRPQEHRCFRAPLGLLLGCLLASAVPARASDAPYDPWEKLNRATYAFNDAFDRMLARPAAKAYKKVMPDAARAAVSNFVANLAYPTVIINDALQGELRDMGHDTARLVVNTVVGVGGLADPATRLGLSSHDRDFGQTFGKWGLGPGPYLVLPFLGPSDLREAPGKIAEHYTSIERYFKKPAEDYGATGLRLLDRRTELLSGDAVVDNAFDPYALVRNSYLARRAYLVHGDTAADEPYDDLPPDEPSEPTTTQPRTDSTGSSNDDTSHTRAIADN